MLHIELADARASLNFNPVAMRQRLSFMYITRWIQGCAAYMAQFLYDHSVEAPIKAVPLYRTS